MRFELARVAFRAPKPNRPPVPPNWLGRLMICPAELKTMVELNDANSGWLSALKASRRNCAYALSVKLTRLYNAMSHWLMPGPRSVLMPESSATLPTAAGAKQEVLMYSFMLRAPIERFGSQVSLTRGAISSLPVISRFSVAADTPLMV